ncbi:hypothetical protein AB4084_10325, partial [Lysobacter sp. 2RAB21]
GLPGGELREVFCRWAFRPDDFLSAAMIHRPDRRASGLKALPQKTFEGSRGLGRLTGPRTSANASRNALRLAGPPISSRR